MTEIEPFFYLGGGWSRFHLRDRRPGAMLVASDDVFQLPFDFGVAKPFGRWVLDARAGATIASGADLLPTMRDVTSSRHSAIMHSFAVSIGIGFEL